MIGKLNQGLGDAMLKKTQIALLVCSIFILPACNEQRVLTPQEQELVNQLKQERGQLEQEIETVTGEIAQYNGGLIKTIKQVREETLKLSRDLVNQRIQAIETGAKVTVIAPTSQPDPERAKSLDSEIEQANQQLAEAKAKAAQYSGGLIAAISMSTVATQEQTLALLQQQLLVAKYGLPFTVKATVEPANKPVNAPTSSISNTAPEPAMATTPVTDENVMLAADGPFGLAMGMTKEMFKGHLTPVSAGVYVLDTPPKAHPQFEQYVVKISDKTGLCWIKGVGKDIPTNGHGIQLKSEFDDFEKKLDERYGSHKRTDFLVSGSLWDDPQYWMRGLQKEDRYLYSVWGRGKKPLPNELSEIGLFAGATSGDNGYLALEYSFTNKKSCDRDIETQKDVGL
ncbi:hypothetical protein OKS80_04820 [Aeromonas veronii]|uniref:hypothetical protein n=1 Tax=Aeromonas TaxID=642 RepID=UPI000D33A7E6|nr:MULTISPECIES: hypothetical protein [Aeromonas]MCX9112224.1 hypothetical protein [Aeromonas veronii]PTT55060.1 hypothetical protein DBR13_08545 [Aeromonas sp. HMWF015]